jgi:hypothetical protein
MNSIIFFILAAVCFAIGAFDTSPKINWISAGLCCATIGMWLV